MFRLSVVYGIVMGTIFGTELAALGNLLAYPLDAFKFILAAVLISFVFFYIVLGIIHLIPVLKKPTVPVGVFMIAAPQIALFWIEVNRPVKLTDPKIYLGIAVSLLLAGVIAFVLGKPLRRLFTAKEGQKKHRFWLFPVSYAVLLLIALGVYSLISHATPVRESSMSRVEPRGKVLLLGVDAAYWPTLMPLVEAGKMPNFQRLIDEGAYGDLPSLVSMYNPFAATITHGIKSAAVWNSIFTGKSPFKHGIKDFVYTQLPGFRYPFRYPLLPSFTPSRKRIMNMFNLKHRPFNSTHRKTKAAWNIYTDAGLEVGALGWWMTWPAEEINGDLLSDRFDDPLLPMRWFPEDILKPETIDSLLERLHHPPQDELAQFSSFQYDPDYEENYKESSRIYFEHLMYYNFIKSYYHDKFRVNLGLDLMQKHPYTFFSVYIYGLDTAGHAFSRFKNPELFPDVTPQEIEYFGGIIDKYHQWVDVQIGKFLGQVDDNTTVVICSDHGMGPWTGIKWEKEELRLSGSHRKNGIIILWGPNIQKGVKIHPKNLLDVLPTVLYLTGLPVASDMDGAVITSAIEPAYLQQYPVKKIKTYETERYKFLTHSEMETDDDYDENMLKRLKALGYLK